MKHIQRVPCRACLNTNYLPDSFHDLLLQPETGWEYSGGKFLLRFKYCGESVEAARNFGSILKKGGILPSFLTIHDREDYYQFITYEDNIRRTVRNSHAHMFIFNSMQMMFSETPKQFVEFVD